MYYGLPKRDSLLTLNFTENVPINRKYYLSILRYLSNYLSILFYLLFRRQDIFVCQYLPIYWLVVVLFPESALRVSKSSKLLCIYIYKDCNKILWENSTKCIFVLIHFQSLLSGLMQNIEKTYLFIYISAEPTSLEDYFQKGPLLGQKGALTRPHSQFPSIWRSIIFGL